MLSAQDHPLLDDVVCGYIECLLWSSYDDDGPLDDRFDAGDLSGQAQSVCRAACAEFLGNVEADDLEVWSEDRGGEYIGHDLWLTRNHHGAGFWDRYYQPGQLHNIGKRFTDEAQMLGESDAYIGDDGLVWVSQ